MTLAQAMKTGSSWSIADLRCDLAAFSWSSPLNSTAAGMPHSPKKPGWSRAASAIPAAAEGGTDSMAYMMPWRAMVEESLAWPDSNIALRAMPAMRLSSLCAGAADMNGFSIAMRQSAVTGLAWMKAANPSCMDDAPEWRMPPLGCYP